MQHRQHEVDVAQDMRDVPGGAGYHGRVALVCPWHDVSIGLRHGLHSGQLSAGDRELGRIVGDLQPGAIRRDADGDHLVLVPVDHSQHVAAAEAGDRMLGPSAAEDHGDPDPPFALHDSSPVP